MMSLFRPVSAASPPHVPCVVSGVLGLNWLGVCRWPPQRWVTCPSGPRALASARGHTVVVLIPLLSNNLFVDLLEAVHRVLHSAGYQILIGVTHYQPEDEALVASYLAHRPAGFLLTGFDRTAGCQGLLTQNGVPCVHLMETSSDPTLYCVGFSQTDAGRAMAATT